MKKKLCSGPEVFVPVAVVPFHVLSSARSAATDTAGARIVTDSAGTSGEESQEKEKGQKKGSFVICGTHRLGTDSREKGPIREGGGGRLVGVGSKQLGKAETPTL